ncbi:cell wall-binding repeat-containing protein [Clostridium sp. A1-XYC3]|uniref:Cell wall-binding repeat-containing protein n=1 Tax=Clostridium tanneri TaxID=3037988 RepID=A0ABU4JWQ8_9CLOT|nr:cell wall-binding repeat-containing protein [Clostridium sp. A1-XYC3]MDW8802582.1 cell wall-binding repeat-containing protein [Clostridium sp. A1-XYC3]
MKKITTRVLASATLMSLVLTTAISTGVVQASEQITRIGEADRYETAAKVATTNWTNPENVILVSGEGYADAVSASVLAKQLDAPILLTTPKSLSSSAKAALDTLSPKNIYVIGGNASVSQSVRTELKKYNYKLVELSGKNRYETNTAVAKKLVELGVNADNVMLVGGEGFSDALSVASVAAAKGQILLLGSNDNGSMKSILEFIKAHNSKTTVIGTSNVINDSMYSKIGAIERVHGGANRFETNLNVLRRFAEDLKTDKLFIANASGDGYADALVASSLAGKWASNLVLIDNASSSSTSEALDYIKNKKNDSTALNVIGGRGVVPDSIISKIEDVPAEVPETPTINEPTVKSVTSNGLSQIKVVFNTDVDEDTAELVRNYQIDGDNLSSSSASATVQADKRTVLITFSKPFAQNSDAKFTVKDAILDSNLNYTIKKFQQKLEFFDTGHPTLDSVTPVGGNKLVVKFSQPIRMDKSALSSMKINRQSAANYGLNSSESTFYNNSGEWADKVELYFNSSLPMGTNTFTIPDGDVGKKFDTAAGFPVKATSFDFTIGSTSGTPEVTKVTSEGLSAIYITYNKTMDKQTALEDSNYKINNSTVAVDPEDITFVEGSEDKIVKIKDLDRYLEDGENEILIKDNVEDTYGNEIKETKMKFDVGNDSDKPQVTNASIIDKNTIRVKFNKDVVSSYATDESNYKLIDSSGTDISYKINDIIRGSSSSADYKSTYFIKFKDADRLTDYEYTLTVRNIIDTNTVPNIMDTTTKTVTNSSSSAPSVVSITKKSDDTPSVVIFFDRFMDEDSLLNYANYYITNGEGKTERLPSDSKLFVNSDGKSVTIEFSSSYEIGDSKYDNYIKRVGVSDVKSREGVPLVGLYMDNISKSTSNGPEFIDNSGKLTYDGDDIRVTLSLTAPLDVLNTGDFKVSGKTPDSGLVSGNDVILIFKSGIKNNEKIDAINSNTTSTTISITNPLSVDVAGRKLKSASDILVMPPRTVANSWSARGGYISSVDIVFNQDIDDDIEKSYNDDFVFINESTGKRLDVTSVSVDDRTITYSFDNNSVQVGDKINVKANSYSSSISIRGEEEDDNGYYGVYSPSEADLDGRSITAKK